MHASQGSSPDVAKVPVKAGEVYFLTLMDASDAEQLGERRLSLGSHGYAQIYWEGRVTLLHRWILGLKRGDRRIGDHINGDPLDNRRANLRAVTPSGSSQNVSGRGVSKFRGVYPARSGKWNAQVKSGGVVYYLGTFASEETAALAADKKRRELMPDYAGIRLLGASRRADKRRHVERVARKTRLEKVREWARANGFEVNSVGRVPGKALRAYADEHPDEET